MKKIKVIYWIFFSVFAALTILFAILADEINRGSTILSGVALMTSSIALGLSDQKKNYFNGEVKIWTALVDEKIPNGNSHYRVSMHLVNRAAEPVYDVVYRLRIPSKISSNIDGKNNNARIYEHGNSKIIVDDSYGFLGTLGEDRYIPIDVIMQLPQWKQGNIYLTISGSNISPTTFKVKTNEKESLITSTIDKPHFAQKIKK